MPFDWFVECALYETDGGFFARGRGAGRSRHDFVTSPEVGPLFGALVARALDGWWERLGCPDPFVVVEAGAGGGRLAREVLRAGPACLPALRYVLVERSAALRAEQRQLLVIEPPDEAIGPYAHSEEAPVPVAGTGPVFTALDDLPALASVGVVMANELLDNLPFGIAEWSGDAWQEIRVGLADRPQGTTGSGTGAADGANPEGDGGSAGGGLPKVEPRFVEVAVPAAHEVVGALATLTAGLDVAAGARLPIPRGLDEWLAGCGTALSRGFVVLIDYVVDVEDVLERAPSGWLRTYREQGRGGPHLEQPGSQDITADVVAEQLRHAARASGLRVVEELSQAEWLDGLGIDDLVEEGRRVWGERAHLGDLAAIAARSRVHEAAALTDPEGLGGHRVVILRR